MHLQFIRFACQVSRGALLSLEDAKIGWVPASVQDRNPFRIVAKDTSLRGRQMNVAGGIAELRRLSDDLQEEVMRKGLPSRETMHLRIS